MTQAVHGDTWRVGQPNQEPDLTPRRAPRLAASLLLVTCAAGCSGDTGDAQPAVQRSPLLQPQRYTETAPATYRVRLETSAGDVVIQVQRDWAPIGADRFYNLAKGGFYDDSRVYRVVAGFMAQIGLNADPYVSQAWKTQYLVDDPVVESNTRGRVAFAKGGRHTRTTEIFISYKDNSALDAEGFAPLGTVIEGMDDEHGGRVRVDPNGDVLAQRVVGNARDATAVDGDVEVGPRAERVGIVDRLVLTLGGEDREHEVDLAAR